ITDQTMPGMTGVELVKAIRKIRPEIPVILNSGFSDHIDASAAAELDITYMEKPLRAKTLIQTIGELIQST
ncbi:MAG: response regulator, partial [Fuerstiella sp.]|nr:response regulator [Fuerstiella sp.]